MIVWGSYNIEFREESGEFPCPQCEHTETYSIWRTYRYFHLFFVPLVRQEAVSERVRCERCGVFFSVMVLTPIASMISSTAMSEQRSDGSVTGTIGNVIALTEQSATELRRRHVAGGFGQDVVVRVTLSDDREQKYLLQFDFAVADGQDWIGESLGIPIVVDRRDAPLLLGKTIDFQEGVFCDYR